MGRGARALGAIAVTAAIAVGTVATTAVVAPAAGAGTVAADAHTVVREILFPVVGRASYADTFGACRSGCTRGHEGTDIMAAQMTPLVAVRDARVRSVKTTATPDGSEGNYVFLEDDAGWQYWYIHLNNDTPGTDDGANPPGLIVPQGIERGARVRAGQLVGFVGDSGNAERTAHHVHFEIHNPNGEVVDPYQSLVVARRLAAPLTSTGVLDPAAAFVDALFSDFLGRAPSDLERAQKEADLASGLDRGSVVSGFAGSDEWVSALLDRYYRDTLGRGADARGKAYWTQVLRDGRAPASVAADFYGSEEYRRRVGGTDAAWISDLYDVLAQRPATTGEVDRWVALLRGGARPGDVAHDLFQSLESRQRRVSELYLSLLGRGTDASGLAYWADVLRDGHDLRLATYLATSDEYAQRAVRLARELAASSTR